MRKITENMLHAIRHGKAWKGPNTKTVRTLPHDDVQGVRVFLHDNQIAFIPDDEALPIRVSLAGWDTNTTRARVSAIAWEYCGCTIGRHKGVTGIDYRSRAARAVLGASEWVTLQRKGA